MRLTDEGGLCKVKFLLIASWNQRLDSLKEYSNLGSRRSQEQVSMKQKAFILSVCLLGVVGVCYGMANKNHAVFIAGLVFVVVGYLMIRKKLKAHIRTKYRSEDNRKRTRQT